MSAWRNKEHLNPKKFVCSYCGNLVSSNTGYYINMAYAIFICPHCDNPVYFSNGNQIPGVAPGNSVEDVPDRVCELYNESRRCVAVNSFTGSVLLSRKLLMNIAVEQGAEENLKFIQYVDYLAGNGFVPPNGRGWVDHIRKKGNEATHEIEEIDREDAVELISFLEMLLKFIYEFPARMERAR